MKTKSFAKNRFSNGSALILAVVLTSLLAIIGAMFLMASRVDKTATSAIAQNKQLNFAVETVIAIISQELARDVPHNDPCRPQEYQEYYDYPDYWLEPGPDEEFDPPEEPPETRDDFIMGDPWLASLEPDANDNGTPVDPCDDIFYWRQISDVTGYLRERGFATRCVKVDPVPGMSQPFNQDFIREYSEIELESEELAPAASDDGFYNDEPRGQLADADGDGIADSKWIELDNITSNRAEPIYVAIRIVDNCAMVNVNTAYKFDPNDPNVIAHDADSSKYIDGSSQTQINLDGLAVRPDDVNQIHFERCAYNYPSMDDFQDNMVWRLNSPAQDYLPFDISDELEMRYRHCITSKSLTRLERTWKNTVGGKGFKDEPYAGGSLGKLIEWYVAVTSPYVSNSDTRHSLTTYNFDTIIDPNGHKMINVNKPLSIANDVNDANVPKATYVAKKIYDSLRHSLPADFAALPKAQRTEIKDRLAQLAANLVDFADDDTDVTVLEPNDPNNPRQFYYGFEAQPFISEIALKHLKHIPGSIYYAVELYNPFDKVIDLNDFELELTYGTDPYGTVDFDSNDVISPNAYFLVASDVSRFTGLSRSMPNVKQDSSLRFFGSWQPVDPTRPEGPVIPGLDTDPTRPPGPSTTRPFRNGNLYLKRKVTVVDSVDPNNVDKHWIYVDRQVVDPNKAPTAGGRFYQRDDRDWHIAYQTLSQKGDSTGSFLAKNLVDPNDFTGHNFSFFLPNPRAPRQRLVTVGDITRILTIGHGTAPDSTIGQWLEEIGRLWELDPSEEARADEESRIRLDLRDPFNRNVFQYLTVFDPTTDDIDNDGDGEVDNGELKIPGRININTAPWYVIAQLPWVSQRKNHAPNYDLARAIVAYRDKTDLSHIGGPSYADYRGKGGRGDALKQMGFHSFRDVREAPGFESIAELNFVIAKPKPSALVPDPNTFSIANYALDAADLTDFPDLTTDGPGLGDGIIDDFEERDIIFSRISNLVTVRSDVFTAYILVRIGTDGPQKRVIAILDRSEVRFPGDKVKIVALHHVPDPR